MDIKINPEFDKRYDIRLAVKDDIPDIMAFLDEYWRKGHIMAVNRNLFEYEYVHGDEVDFVIAIDREKKSIEGIFGFLRCTEKKSGDIWGSMWMVTEKPDTMKLLGIELARRVYPLTGCRSHIGNGANPNTTVPLRKIFFREKTVKMKQYYRLNPGVTVFRVADVRERIFADKNPLSSQYRIREFDSFEQLLHSFSIDEAQGIPHKDSWYIRHRFFEHPVFKYLAYGIYDGEDICRAVFFARCLEVNGSKILRIVDYLGLHEMIGGLYDVLSDLLNEGNYEYIDFFEFGIEDEYMKDAGFIYRDDTENIIPNYFEPFLRENIDIWAHYKEDGTTFFKADGDQDRPNKV